MSAHKSKKYEQYYGQPYVPKTLVKVKRCVKCGREQPENSKGLVCPFCGGPLATGYFSKSSVALSHQ